MEDLSCLLSVRLTWISHSFCLVCSRGSGYVKVNLARHLWARDLQELRDDSDVPLNNVLHGLLLKLYSSPPTEVILQKPSRLQAQISFKVFPWGFDTCLNQSQNSESIIREVFDSIIDFSVVNISLESSFICLHTGR